MPNVVNFRYRAFLSYSHRDKEFGSKLHRELERYSIPRDLVSTAGAHGPVPKKLRPIFRDRFDLEAGHSLHAQVGSALEQSEALIILCSPNSARSPYVNEEIRQFKALGRGHRIYPIIIAGEPGDPEKECFPAALRFKIGPSGHLTDEPEEPLAADARAVGDGFELAKLKLVAGLTGVDLDQLRRREAEEQKRQKRFWIGLTAFMALLAIGALTASGVAYWQRELKQEALTKNEDLLDSTLKHTSSLVKASIKDVYNYGVPIEHGLGVLKITDDIFADMDRIGATSEQLPLRKAELYLRRSKGQQILGNIKESIHEAIRARKIAEDELAIKGGDEDMLFTLAASDFRIASGKRAHRMVSFADKGYARSRKILEGQLKGLNAEKAEWLQLLFDIYLVMAHRQYEQNNYDKTLEFVDLGIEVADRLLEIGDEEGSISGRAVALIKKADTKRVQKKTNEALQANLEGALLVEQALERYPKNILWRGRLYHFQSNRGDIYRISGKHSDALGSFKKARDAITPNHLRDPNNSEIASQVAYANVKIGESELKLNNIQAAVDAFKQADAIYENFSVKDEKNRSYFYGYLDTLQGLGEALRVKRQFVEMGGTHEKRVLFADKLLAAEPDNGEFLRHLATGTYMAGEAYRLQKNKELARPKYERALKAFPRLMAVRGERKGYKRQLGSAYLQIGHWYADQKNFMKALAHHEKAADLLEQATEGVKPGSWTYLDFMSAVESVGFTLSETGKPDDAVKWFEKALPIRKQHADARPEYEHQRNLALTTEMLGEAWRRLENSKEALTLFEDSLGIRFAALSEKEDDTQRRRNLANTWKLIGQAQVDLGDCNKSRDAFATAKQQLKQAMDEYHAAHNQPRKGWTELFSEIDALHEKARASCPNS